MLINRLNTMNSDSLRGVPMLLRSTRAKSRYGRRRTGNLTGSTVWWYSTNAGWNVAKCYPICSPKMTAKNNPPENSIPNAICLSHHPISSYPIQPTLIAQRSTITAHQNLTNVCACSSSYPSPYFSKSVFYLDATKTESPLYGILFLFWMTFLLSRPFRKGSRLLSRPFRNTTLRRVLTGILSYLIVVITIAII